jgi:hypothetical protein
MCPARFGFVRGRAPTGAGTAQRMRRAERSVQAAMKASSGSKACSKMLSKQIGHRDGYSWRIEREFTVLQNGNRDSPF